MSETVAVRTGPGLRERVRYFGKDHVVVGYEDGLVILEDHDTRDRRAVARELRDALKDAMDRVREILDGTETRPATVLAARSDAVLEKIRAELKPMAEEGVTRVKARLDLMEWNENAGVWERH